MAKEGGNPELLNYLQGIIRESHELLVENANKYYSVFTERMSTRWASPDAVKFWGRFTEHLKQIVARSQADFADLEVLFDNAAYNVLASQGAEAEYTKKAALNLPTNFEWVGKIVEKLNGEVYIDSEVAYNMKTDLHWFQIGLQSAYDYVINMFANNEQALLSDQFKVVHTALEAVRKDLQKMIGYFSPLEASINTDVQGSAEASMSALCAAEASFDDNLFTY